MWLFHTIFYILFNIPKVLMMLVKQPNPRNIKNQPPNLTPQDINKFFCCSLANIAYNNSVDNLLVRKHFWISRKPQFKNIQKPPCCILIFRIINIHYYAHKLYPKCQTLIKFCWQNWSITQFIQNNHSVTQNDWNLKCKHAMETRGPGATSLTWVILDKYLKIFSL
jgi:hypothetical protein